MICPGSAYSLRVRHYGGDQHLEVGRKAAGWYIERLMIGRNDWLIDGWKKFIMMISPKNDSFGSWCRCNASKGQGSKRLVIERLRIKQFCAYTTRSKECFVTKRTNINPGTTVKMSVVVFKYRTYILFSYIRPIDTMPLWAQKKRRCLSFWSEEVRKSYFSHRKISLFCCFTIEHWVWRTFFGRKGRGNWQS